MSSLLFFLLAATLAPGESFSAGNFRGQVIYGDDNRIDAAETTDPLLRSLAESSVALIPAENMRATAKGAIPFGPEFGPSKQLCAEERFYSQPTPAFCSGVLVNEDTVLTAAHCIDHLAHCHETRFVFGYQSDTTEIPARDIYGCREIIVKNEEADFALIRLDRASRDRRPALYRPIAAPKVKKLIAVGYPSGLPLKFSVEGKVRGRTADRIQVSLDVFEGNSGSPVFTPAGELAGILIEGEDDFDVDPSRGCLKSKHCRESGCAGEEVLKIGRILSAGRGSAFR